jgi:SAM-dependent methyltransferase
MPLQRIVQVLRDRRRKSAMTDASYWDERARSRAGFARSVWHSENFSIVWDARQQELLREELGAVLGKLDGKRIADVGCGTGRITRFLAREGASAVGFDFSPATVDAARTETRDMGLEATFEVADVVSGVLPGDEGSFDAALTVGCLAVACPDMAALDRAMQGIAKLVRRGGPVLLLEPIHTTKFLGRVLREPLSAWVASGERAGLRLDNVRPMGLVATRLAFSSLDLPSWIVDGVFDAGERALDRFEPLARAADYRLVRFSRV